MGEKRKAPKRYVYYGLVLYYRADYKDDVVSRINISSKERLPSSEQMSEGKIILTRDYVPVSSNPIPRGEEIPENVLRATVEKALFQRGYFEDLVSLKANLLNQNTQWGLVGPYALARHLKISKISVNRQIEYKKAMDTMVELWGKSPVSQVTPQNCAKDLLKLAPTVADICLTLLRHLWLGGLANIVGDPHMWERYRFPERSNSYSAKRQQKRITDITIIPDSICGEIISLCEACASDDKRYIATLMCLFTPIGLEEVCALRWGDIEVVHDYTCMAIHVQQELVEAEDSLKGKKKRKRKNRNIIRPIIDHYQKRTLPAGRVLMQVLLPLFNKANKEEYLLSDSRNNKRHLSAEQMNDWLDSTFGDLVLDKQKRSHVIDYLHETAIDNLRRFGLRQEELRYQQGLAPQHTDAQYYVCFSIPAMLSKMAKVQDCWVRYLGHGFQRNVVHLSAHKEKYILNGTKGNQTHGEFLVEVPAGYDENIYLQLSALLGFSTHIEIS